jgi:arginine decarboxylase
VRIIITKGVGHGPTAVGAFDAALLDAGVANYNLIPLSSVIPPGATLERKTFVSSSDEYGHRLYVVMARNEVHEVGQHAWAGIGWTQEETSGRGLFVELEGPSQAYVHHAIEATLEPMKCNRPYQYGANHTESIGVTCTGSPACALVIAVYQSQAWDHREWDR